MDLFKKPDAINSIVKTIDPVHLAYSKQNKEYNKYFLSLNLDVLNFMKTLNKLHKRKKAPTLYETLYKKNETNKYIYERDIQKTFNKLRKMTDNKYVPKELMDKFKFNIDIREKKFNKKSSKKNDGTEIRNKIKVNDNFFNEITLDPGRYDPKYSLIFKKTPNIYFEKYKQNNSCDIIQLKNEDVTYNEINKENDALNKQKDKIKEKLDKLNQKEKNIDTDKKLLSLNDIDKFKKINNNSMNRIMSSNYSKGGEQNKKIFSSSMISFTPGELLQPKINTVNLKLFNKTQNSNFFQKINLKKNKNRKNSADAQSKKIEFNYISNKKNNTFIEEKMIPKLDRCQSCKNSNMKIFSFNKMRSRKKNLFRVKQDSRRLIYSPDCEIYTAKEIKLKLKYEKFQNFKKYAVNKIIRNYNYFSPKDYFIFDINRKNKTNDKNYINNINEKYNI